jgi:carbon monoxide dehydrogenase subunit G
VIEVDERFEVEASPEAVWVLLADPYAVVGCVPGAAIVSRADDGSLETSLTVKFGPLSVGFQSHAVLELEPERMVGRISARGKDKQGGARFHANATFTVAESPVGSVVVTRGEVELSGRLSSIIESGAGVVVKRMSAEFAECLRARCAAASTS